MARSRVKSRSHYDIAHLHQLTNVPIKYQLPTPYGFRDTAQTNFFLPPTQSGWWGHSETRKSLKEDSHQAIGSQNSYPFRIHTNLQIVKRKLY